MSSTETSTAVGGVSEPTASGQAADVATLAPALDTSAPNSGDSRTPGVARRGLRFVFNRGLYWLPVFGPMILFGQIALLGLRPALCERARLADAEVVLQERFRGDVAQNAVINANVRARKDPIFLERQRRWLHVAAPAR